MEVSVRGGTGRSGLKAAGAAIVEPIAKWYILFHVGQPHVGGSSSVAERQLPKLNVAGSIPVSRSKKISDLQDPT
jgi:hypothetical protein